MTERAGKRKAERVELQPRHVEFLERIARAVQEKRGARPGLSEILRALVDVVMDEGLSPEQVEALSIEEKFLESMRATRKAVMEEIRRTESDLNHVLVHGPDPDGMVSVFRRNLKYQNEKLRSLEKQIDELLRSRRKRDGWGFSLLRRLLSQGRAQR